MANLIAYGKRKLQELKAERAKGLLCRKCKKRFHGKGVHDIPVLPGLPAYKFKCPNCGTIGWWYTKNV